jgi:RimJ/RimL family protein N-acetyltransferase
MRFHPYHLRPVTADDAPALFEMIDRNRSRLEDFFAGTVALTRTLADTRKHVTNMLSKADAGTYHAFVIEDVSNGAMAGFVDIKNIDRNIPKAELGAFMDASYQGQGIASKALEAITRHCFEDEKFDKLLIRTHASNIGARKVIERNGYQLEGTVRKDYRTTAGVVVDLLYYGRIRESE